MTEKRADDNSERDTREQERKEQQRRWWQERRQQRWETNNKAINTLMVGHAAGLVTCLTLIKDYHSTPQLKGLGLFIALFGVGLVCAISSSVVWIVAHNYFIVLPTGRRVNIPTANWTG
jgi:K+-sensing histidine kinase KdpD